MRIWISFTIVIVYQIILAIVMITVFSLPEGNPLGILFIGMFFIDMFLIWFGFWAWEAGTTYGWNSTDMHLTDEEF